MQFRWTCDIWELLCLVWYSYKKSAGLIVANARFSAIRRRWHGHREGQPIEDGGPQLDNLDTVSASDSVIPQWYSSLREVAYLESLSNPTSRGPERSQGNVHVQEAIRICRRLVYKAESNNGYCLLSYFHMATKKRAQRDC